MKLKILVVAMIALFGIQPTCYAHPKKPSYNYSRGVEEAKKGNNEEAMEFFSKEIKNNPKNGYAYFALALLKGEEDNFDEAMKSINIALRKLPKKDKEQLSNAYHLRGEFYAFIGDTINYLNDMAQALKIDNENEDAYESLGQVYYELGRYEESDSIFRRLIKCNPASFIGNVGLGRNANDNERYEEAINYFNTALRLQKDSSQVYTFRGEAYLSTERYSEAIDDFIQAYSIDNYRNAAVMLHAFPDDRLRLIITKLKSQAAKDPYEATWWFLMGNICQSKELFTEAIEYYAKAYEIDEYAGFKEYMADCYNAIGDFHSALQLINEILPEAPDNTDRLQTKGISLGESGDTDGAIEVFSRIIELNPENPVAYFRRGHYRDLDSRWEDALKDFEMGLMLEPNYSYAMLSRADLLTRMGKAEDASEIYRHIIENDTIPHLTSTAMFALLALGEKDKAIDFMDKVIESDTTSSRNYYDYACFYARLGDMGQALYGLRKALEKGLSRFHFIRNEYDFTELRKLPEFEALLKEYETTPSSPAKVNPPEPDAKQVSERVEIPFTPESGCFAVKCTINELPLNFLFDTGASTVSLSQLEANFMLKNGYLSKNDIIGSGHFTDANGNVSEGTIINLREVDFGGLKLNNVKASVVRNQKAPLLLGQTVLSRLGSIEIDNPGKRLIINHSK